MKFRLIEDIHDYLDQNLFNNYIEDDTFAEDIKEFLEDLAKEDVEENFKTATSEKYHFYKHCIGKSNKKSNRQNVYYDFIKLNDFINYEALISKEMKNSIYNIDSLYDNRNIIKLFRLLFEGNKAITFSKLCGLDNNISIGLHSWANNSTTNYDQNTIDICIFDKNNLTKTIYPVDANYLENKINNIIDKNYSKKQIKYILNH